MISGNTAYLGGGVANSVGGTVTIAKSTASGNTAIGSQGGGGLRNDGTATLTNSTISGNLASGNPNSEGGGVVNVCGSLTLTISTVSGNNAAFSGGGEGNYRVAVNLTNSTISGNTAPIGGGPSNRFGQIFFSSIIITANAAVIASGVESASGSSTVRSDTVFIRTLVSGNLSPKGAEVYQASGGITTANYFNLFGHGGLITAQALGGSGQFLSGSRMILSLPCTAHGRPSVQAY